MTIWIDICRGFMDSSPENVLILSTPSEPTKLQNITMSCCTLMAVSKYDATVCARKTATHTETERQRLRDRDRETHGTCCGRTRILTPFCATSNRNHYTQHERGKTACGSSQLPIQELNLLTQVQRGDSHRPQKVHSTLQPRYTKQ
jgi:hypothetical protein